jgi:3-oxoacyl-[acyl-carrier protein] reductase
MDLKLKDKSFLICGASSGFGEAISKILLKEGANLIAVARDEQKLKKLKQHNENQIKIYPGDLTKSDTIEELFNDIDLTGLSGALINAGGPPAMKFMETKIDDWDEAYRTLLRWKVLITQKLIPIFKDNGYGRILYIESASVKQPIDNLVLSNSLRMSVVGMVKSLSRELLPDSITLNIMAPGYHETQAVERLIHKKSLEEGIDYSEAKRKIENAIPAGIMGSPKDFGTLAAWLLSEYSGYLSGQTISVDGGLINYVFG